MTQQSINIGNTANDRSGDSLRVAFNKINQNFTELYVALGLADDITLNLGNFVFEDNTVRLTNSNNDDSTSTQIEIAQPVRIESDLTVGGDLLPQTANGGDLGSSTQPWRSLYVSSNTIYIGTTAVSVDDTGNLIVGGQAVADVGTAAWNNITGKPTFASVATSGSYTDLSNKPTIPADVGDLTDTGNLLFDGDYGSLSNTPTIPTLTSQLTNDSGFITAADIAGGTLTIDVNNTGDLQGSVFADDSTLLVDGVNGRLVGPLLTNSIASPETGNLELEVGRAAGGAFSVTAWADKSDLENGWKQILWGYDTDHYEFFVGGDIYAQGSIATNDVTASGLIARQGQYLYVTSAHAGGSATNVAFIYDTDNNRPRQIFYGKTEFGNNGAAPIVDFTGATVTGLAVSGQGFTYNEIDGTSEIGVTADVFDFGDGKTIDMQNSNVLFTGSTVSGLYDQSLNTTDAVEFLGVTASTISADNISINAGGVINLQGENITGVNELGVITVNAGDTNTGLLIIPGTADTDVFPVDPYTSNDIGGRLYYSSGGNRLELITNPSGTIRFDFQDVRADMTSEYFEHPAMIRVGTTLRFQSDGTEQTTAYTGYHTGDMTGSVFADDSTLLVDGVNGKIRGDVEDVVVNVTSTLGDVNITSADDVTVTASGGDTRLYSNGLLELSTNVGEGLDRRNWVFSDDGTLTVPSSSLGSGLGMIWSPFSGSLWLSGRNVDSESDGNGVVLNGGQNAGTGRGGGISLFGGNSEGGTGGSIFIETGIGQGGADNGAISIGTAYAKTITIGKASQSANNRFFGNLVGNVENDDDITITVANDDSTTYAWNFGNTGALTLPGDLKLSGGIFATTSSAIGIVGSWYQDNGTSDGGGVTVQAGAGQRDGGDINITAGSTVDRDGGSIYIKSGNSIIGTAGPITIEAGNASNRGTLTARASTFQIDAHISLNGSRTISPVSGSGISGDTLTIQGGATDDEFGSGGDVIINGGAGGDGTFGIVQINNNTTGSIYLGKTDGTGEDIQTYSRLQIHRGVVESYEAKADATGVVEHDCDAGHLFYHTSPDANWTVNLTNLNAYNGMSTNIVIVIEQGGTPYYPSALQIGGAAQTIKWLGNVTPIPQANKTEIATFTIFYNGSAYNVLGSYSTYG